MLISRLTDKLPPRNGHRLIVIHAGEHRRYSCSPKGRVEVGGLCKREKRQIMFPSDGHSWMMSSEAA